MKKIDLQRNGDAYLSPTEICRKYRLQMCHVCDDPGCGDNTSPLAAERDRLKRQLERAKAWIPVGLVERVLNGRHVIEEDEQP